MDVDGAENVGVIGLEGFIINNVQEEEANGRSPISDCLPVVRPKINWRRRPMRHARLRAQIYNFGTNGMTQYRDGEVKKRFDSICENLGIVDKEDLYTLFLKRLDTRKKLESSHKNLEILVEALHYIQSMSCKKTVSARDAINKLRKRSGTLNLRRFVKYVSKLCAEAKIEWLPVVPNANIVRQMLDDLILALRQSDKSEDILSNVKEINISPEVARLFQDPCLSGLDECLDIPCNKGEEDAMSHGSDSPHQRPTHDEDVVKFPKARRSRMAALIEEKYDLVSDTTLRLVEWTEKCGLKPNFNVLNARSRTKLHCRKTFLASALHVALLMERIQVHQKFLLNTWNVVRTSFYKNCSSIFMLVVQRIRNKYGVLVNSKFLTLTFLKHMLRNMDSPDTKTRVEPMQYDFRENYATTEKVSHDDLPTVFGDDGKNDKMSSNCSPEIRFLNNVMGAANPVDDTLWKFDPLSDQRGKTTSTPKNGAMHNTYEDAACYLTNMLGESDAGNGFPAKVPSEIGEVFDEKPWIEVPTYDDKRGDAQRLSCGQIRSLTLKLGYALGFVNKDEHRQPSMDPGLDAKLFEILTYYLDAFSMDRIGPLRKQPVNSYTSKQRSVVTWKQGKRKKYKSFAHVCYGPDLAHTMATTFKRGMAVALIVEEERKSGKCS
ncbi:hypothetical protein, conserved [Babesia bigemina]|uniref:Uncharacterized protein n=1 Tax=Babesia bigemina TaxID=5866 RepID=A0A061D1H2_BABBI|nr:hypothetical protein, conserved [Babesia bigemina]CDR94488.1 hypothetical protein, conserved [Babesia bigemina]|eukprot:XP_012766674.1 hypothetical protein, conserved [Babesia bigemina]